MRRALPVVLGLLGLCCGLAHGQPLVTAQELQASLQAPEPLALKANPAPDAPRIELLRPFIDLDKAAIARLGHELGVDFARTWSCYKGGNIHCGVCGTCVERREAFQLAGLPDPTEYALRPPLPSA